MKRKIFMICSVWHEDYIRELLCGIRKRIANEDLEFHIFASYDTAGLMFQQKEQEIFTLPNIEDYDGVLIASNSEGNRPIVEQAIAEYYKHNKKILSIEQRYDNASYIGVDNYTEFYRIVEHMLKEHDCKIINYLGGPADNVENQERFRAFCDCAKKYGVSIDPKRVSHRQFLHADGAEAYLEWKKEGLHLPDAVICANDNMALGYCGAASADGHCAPDDFLITGFDNLEEGQFFSPSITSVNRGWAQLGYDSMDILLGMLDGKVMPGDFFSKGSTVLNESCGCGLDNRNIKQDLRYIYHRKKQEEQLEIKQRLNRQLLSISRDLKEMQHNIQECFARLGIRDMALCLNHSMFEEDVMGTKNGYDSVVDVMTKYGQARLTREQTMDTRNLPMTEHGKMFLMATLHLNGDTYGYAVAPYIDNFMRSSIHREFLETVSLALANIRQREELGRLNQKLQKLYVQDPMTGLFNRFGYMKHAQQYFEMHNGNIFIVYVDMDNLKEVNDNFGHAMGDRAINGVAQAIGTAFNDNCICVRMGGDEFLIMDCSKTEEELIYKEELFTKYLEDYSVRTNLPFVLKASVGHINSVGNNDPLEILVKRADARMYEVKQQRKRKDT